MRNLGTLWNRCHNGDIPLGEWQYERKITLDGVVYEDDYIINMSHDKGLIYDHFSLGNCISGRIKTTILPHSNQNMKRGGEIKFELRVVTLNDGESQWNDFGYYYVDRAEEENGRWVIEGFDNMKKLDTAFNRGYDDGTVYPTSCAYAVNVIKDFLGVDLDPRTIIDSNIKIGNPGTMTMRDVLGYIGSLHGGNWYITEENKLRLVIPEISASVMSVGKSNSKRVIESGQLTFDKIIMRYGDNFEDTYSSGTGDNEIEIYNPWSTQSTADKVFSILENYVYLPCESKSSEVNPAVELGDTIDFNGKLVNFWQAVYSLRMYADIIIPDDANKQEDVYMIRIDDLENRVDEIEKGGGGGSDVCVLLSDSNSRILFGKISNYNDKDKCVIIPSIYKDQDITDISSLFMNNDTLEKLILDSNNISDMSRLFYNMKTNGLDLSDFITSNVSNMSYMFYNSDISDTSLSKLNMSKVTNAERMFSGAKIRTIDLSNAKGSSLLENARGMFGGTDTQSIDLSGVNTRYVEDMSGMFSYSKALYISLSSIITNNVRNMDRMFEGSHIDILNLNNFRTEKVVSMRRMFKDSNASIINSSNFDTSSVYDMSEMYMNSNVINLEIYNFDMSNVIFANGMFRGIKTMPKGINSMNTPNLSAINDMFSQIYQPKETLDISKLDLSSITEPVSTVFGGSNFKNLILPKNMTRDIFGTQWANNYKGRTIDISHCSIDNPPYITNVSNGGPITIYVNSTQQKEAVIGDGSESSYGEFIIK